MFECVVLLILLQEGSLSGQSDETADEGVQGVLDAQEVEFHRCLDRDRVRQWEAWVESRRSRTFATSTPCMRPVATLVFPRLVPWHTSNQKRSRSTSSSSVEGSEFLHAEL